MKERLLIFLMIILILNISFTFAALDTSSNVSDKGYACLESKIKDKCSSLSVEDKIFSLAATGECKNEILSTALNNECWPKSGCKIKTTAQAMIALKEQGVNVSKSINWLLAQKMAPTGLDFLLQIEMPKPGKCSISYSGSSSSSSSSYNILINENKKISNNAGSCLSLYGDYWLKVKNTCYDKQFEISCNDSFITEIIYKDSASQTIYVPQQVQNQIGGGKLTEKVNSYCFKQGSSCDYEGSLWASLVLNGFGYDSASYLPYLITRQSANEQFLPESFLYALLGDAYRNDILTKQQENRYWVASGDKFYDTAVALYPFQYDDLTEKSNSISWLEEVQGRDGCWQSIRDTAFILYSIWPKRASSLPNPVQQDCETAGNFCMSRANCASVNGNELTFSGCFGAANICCSKEKPLDTCSHQNGAICSSSETCTGDVIDASDLISGERCCVSGDCVASSTPETPSTEKSQCQTYSGNCRNSCLSSEQQASYICNNDQICCLEASKPARNYLGIIIFSVLIILVFLGLIFRKQLRDILSKIKSGGKGKSSASKFPPRGFPPSTSQIQPRMMPRRIIPLQTQPVRQITRPAAAKKSTEVDEVLKKLKEIGK